MVRLPHDFEGVRTPHEAHRDLLALAHAAHPLSWSAAQARNAARKALAHVGVDRDDGEADHRTGTVTANVDESDRLDIYVDGVFTFAFAVQTCRGAWLTTLDGEDYYNLAIDLGWGCVRLSDAYNDL